MIKEGKYDFSDLKKQLSNPTKSKKIIKEKLDIQYEDSIVAYIDLLGFRDEIKKLNKKESIKRIEELESVFNKIIEPNKGSGIFVNYFSDCICLSEKLPSNNAEQYLDTVFFFLLTLIHLQGELIFCGILIRGGVSIGKHYSSNRLIFSEGLLLAYDIESNRASNPLIMLDETVYKKLLNFHKKKKGTYVDKEHMIFKFNSLLSLSIELPNESHILNYLSFWQEVDSPSYIFPFFQKHKEMIEEGAIKFRKNDRILSKYKWMADYHNYYMQKIYELNEESNDKLLVDIDKFFSQFEIPKIE